MKKKKEIIRENQNNLYPIGFVSPEEMVDQYFSYVELPYDRPGFEDGSLPAPTESVDEDFNPVTYFEPVKKKRPRKIDPTRHDIGREVPDPSKKRVSFQRPLRILVGFSGGVDSTVLLETLYRLTVEDPLTCETRKAIEEHPEDKSLQMPEPRLVLAAAHVNHGIRGEEAIRDREFCRKFCEERGIPFYCLDTDVPSQQRKGESLEATARRIRYEWFGELMQQEHYPIIALAHNADDNLETVLFRLCRGTGLRGLCGIPPARVLNGGLVIRPLLAVSRREILRYAAMRGLSYVTDSTNLEPNAARNRIRNEVVPVLKNAVPGDALAGVTRMTRTLRGDLNHLDTEARLLFQGKERTDLSRTALQRSHPAVAIRAALRLFELAGGEPSETQAAQFARFCISPLSAVHACFPIPGNKDYYIKVCYDNITVEPGSYKEACKVLARYKYPTIDELPTEMDMPSQRYIPLRGCVHFGAISLESEICTYGEYRKRFGEVDPKAGIDAFLFEDPEHSPKNPDPDIQSSQFSSKVYNLSIRIPIVSDKIVFKELTDAEKLSAEHPKVLGAVGDLKKGATPQTPTSDTPWGIDDTPMEKRPRPEEMTPEEMFKLRPSRQLRPCTPDPMYLYGNNFPSFPFNFGNVPGAYRATAPEPLPILPDDPTEYIYDSFPQQRVSSLLVRTRKAGDSILSGKHHKDVRRVMSALHVPPVLRPKLPVICDAEGVLAIPYLLVRDDVLPGPDTPDDAQIRYFTAFYIHEDEEDSSEDQPD